MELNKKTWIKMLGGIIILIGVMLFYLFQGQDEPLQIGNIYFYKTTTQQAKNQFFVEVEYKGNDVLTYTSYEFHNPYNDADYLENYDQFENGKVTKEFVDNKCELYNKVQKEQFPIETTGFTIDTCYSQYDEHEDTYYIVYKYKCDINKKTLKYLCDPSANEGFDNLAKNMALANALKDNKEALDKEEVITTLTSKNTITNGINAYKLIENSSEIDSIKKELKID